MKLAYYIKKDRLKGDSRVESLLEALRCGGHDSMGNRMGKVLLNAGRKTQDAILAGLACGHDR